MKNIMRLISLAALLSIAAISSKAYAATVIDFGTGLAGPGGSIFDDGVNTSGAGILIGALTITGAPANNGTYEAFAELNFDTGIASNFITIVGTVPTLGINSAITLLSGTFDSHTFTPIPGPGGSTEVFSGSGPDTKSEVLLRLLQLDPGTPFDFFGFTIESVNGEVVSTDIINTAVPVPAAVWLFGSGLLGLVGIARRRA